MEAGVVVPAVTVRSVGEKDRVETRARIGYAKIRNEN
jgi:hypothetical protein